MARLLLLLGVVAAVVFAVVAATGHPQAGPPVGPSPPPGPPVSEAERILEERFARGEIDADALARGRQALRNR
ncbi:MAG: SHOCT domain-containing protein [Oryzihumus sp.]